MAVQGNHDGCRLMAIDEFDLVMDRDRRQLAPRTPNQVLRKSNNRRLSMPLTLTINGIVVQAEAGASLFDFAQSVGVRVPTSCQKNGKCKECVVEIAEGIDCLSPLYRV